MTEENKQPIEKRTKKIEAKPLPVDKEKARAIEQGKPIDLASPQREASQQSEKIRSKSEVEKRKETSKTEKAPETKTESKETKTEKPEAKTEDKKAKEEKPALKKKDEAIARGAGIPVSKKQCMYICSMIKNKSPDQAIAELTQVIAFKKAVPFKGEIPHRKGKMMSGRYPIKASKLFINLLKALKGNIIVNQMELDNSRISEASASWAARPMRSGGRAAKRTNVILKAREYKGGKK